MAATIPQHFPLHPPASSLSAVEADLLQRFDSTPAHPTGLHAELRVAATEYGRALRKAAVPPERLVIALKALLCCHGGLSSFPSVVEEQRHHEVALATTAYARVLEWCLDGYFEEAPPTTASAPAGMNAQRAGLHMPG